MLAIILCILTVAKLLISYRNNYNVYKYLSIVLWIFNLLIIIFSIKFKKGIVGSLSFVSIVLSAVSLILYDSLDKKIKSSRYIFYINAVFESIIIYLIIWRLY